MKEDIKMWLRRHKRDRYWLAEAVGVKKRTVDNWLSSPKEIPVACQRLISNLMAIDAANAQQQAQDKAIVQNLVLTVPEATFEAYSRAALHHHMILKEWAIMELDNAAQEARAAALALLAEDPAGNGTFGQGKPHAASPASIVPQGV